MPRLQPVLSDLQFQKSPSPAFARFFKEATTGCGDYKALIDLSLPGV